MTHLSVSVDSWGGAGPLQQLSVYHFRGADEAVTTFPPLPVSCKFLGLLYLALFLTFPFLPNGLVRWLLPIPRNKSVVSLFWVDDIWRRRSY